MNRHAPTLRLLACFLLVLVATKTLQAQALVLCLEPGGGVNLELASGVRCADRIPDSSETSTPHAFDECEGEDQHCADCTDVGVPQIRFQKRTTHRDLTTPIVPASNWLVAILRAGHRDSPPSMTGANVTTEFLPLSTVLRLRTTVLLI